MFAALKPTSTDAQVLQRAHEQAGADQQHQRDRHLRHQQRLAQPACATPITLRLFSFIALARSTCVARSAGIRPKTTPVSMLMPATNASTCQSIAAFWPNGSSFLLQ